MGAAGTGLAVQLLAACSPSGAPSATQAPAPASGGQTAPAQTTAMTKVSYAFASVNPYHWVAVVANEKPELPGKFGIQFDLVTTTNSPNAMNALVGGSVDVAVATPDSAWPAQDKAPDIKQLFATADGTPYVLIAQPEIQKAADLKGMTLGASAVRGGADTTALRVMLNENGLRDTDYTIVQAGAVSDRTAAMKAKSMAAVAQLEPQATQLRDEGFKEIDNANNYPALKNVHSIVLLAKQNFYQGAKSDVAINFVKAWDAITKWLYDPANKGELIAITKKTMSVGDQAAQNAYDLHIGQKVPSQDLHIKEAFMQQFIENQKKAGTENLPSSAMKYVDPSLLDAALKA
jgi:ABC-type nitrate/sulfonate/bicarbonate transport system substrate-binding protein